MLHGKNSFMQSFILGRVVLFLAVFFSFLGSSAWCACQNSTSSSCGRPLHIYEVTMLQ